MIPLVTEQSGTGEKVFDLYSRLLRDRIIFLGTEIDEDAVNAIVAQLLYLEAEDPQKDIQLYINSYGTDQGMITSAMAIYDTIQEIRPDVVTIAYGVAAELAALILASGTPGKRMALSNSRIILNQPEGGARGQAIDIAIRAKEILYQKNTITQILADHTGQSLEKIATDIERDFYMSPEEAKSYGLIDQVITKSTITNKSNVIPFLK